MSDTSQTAKKSVSADWLVRGVLTKIGDIFDRLTGRGWKPSSSLATSELIERLKALMDSETRTERGCTFVPHNIKLKMQWDKFSTDSEKDMKKLETELLAAAVDHINDRRYFTHAPLSLEVKPDYFTPGVRMLVSYDTFTDEEHEAAVNVTLPGADAATANAAEAAARTPGSVEIRASFNLDGNERTVRLRFDERKRMSVGRTKENDLSIDDASVSKMHASVTFAADGRLIVADTGSTNGTFIRGERIAYGKTAAVENGGCVRFGAVDVNFEFNAGDDVNGPPSTEEFRPPALEFTTRFETVPPSTVLQSNVEPPPTEPAIVVGERAAESEND
jgi:hypothetical protein